MSVSSFWETVSHYISIATQFHSIIFQSYTTAHFRTSWRPPGDDKKERYSFYISKTNHTFCLIFPLRCFKTAFTVSAFSVYRDEAFCHELQDNKGFPGGILVKNLPANAENAGKLALIPGSGRSSGVGHGNPRQYSCLKNSMDRGTW